MRGMDNTTAQESLGVFLPFVEDNDFEELDRIASQRRLTSSPCSRGCPSANPYLLELEERSLTPASRSASRTQRTQRIIANPDHSPASPILNDSNRINSDSNYGSNTDLAFSASLAVTIGFGDNRNGNENENENETGTIDQNENNWKIDGRVAVAPPPPGDSGQKITQPSTAWVSTRMVNLAVTKVKTDSTTSEASSSSVYGDGIGSPSFSKFGSKASAEGYSCEPVIGDNFANNNSSNYNSNNSNVGNGHCINSNLSSSNFSAENEGAPWCNENENAAAIPSDQYESNAHNKLSTMSTAGKSAQVKSILDAFKERSSGVPFIRQSSLYDGYNDTENSTDNEEKFDAESSGFAFFSSNDTQSTSGSARFSGQNALNGTNTTVSGNNNNNNQSSAIEDLVEFDKMNFPSTNSEKKRDLGSTSSQSGGFGDRGLSSLLSPTFVTDTALGQKIPCTTLSITRSKMAAKRAYELLCREIVAKSSQSSTQQDPITDIQSIYGLYDESSSIAPTASAQVDATQQQMSPMVIFRQSVRAHNGPIWCAQVSHDRRYFATGGQDGIVKVWKLNLLNNYAKLPNGGSEGEASPPIITPHFRQCVGHASDIMCLAFSPLRSNKLISLSLKGELKLWRITTTGPSAMVNCECVGSVQTTPKNGPASFCAFNPLDDNIVYTASIDEAPGLHRWDLKTGKHVTAYSSEYLSSIAFTCATVPNVNGSTDPFPINVDPIANGTLISSLEGLQTMPIVSQEPIFNNEFNGIRLITGSYVGTITIRNADTLKVLCKFTANSTKGKHAIPQKITGLQVSPSGWELMVASADNRNRIYSLRSMRQIVKLRGMHVNAGEKAQLSGLFLPLTKLTHYRGNESGIVQNTIKNDQTAQLAQKRNKKWRENIVIRDSESLIVMPGEDGSITLYDSIIIASKKNFISEPLLRSSVEKIHQIEKAIEKEQNQKKLAMSVASASANLAKKTRISTTPLTQQQQCASNTSARSGSAQTGSTLTSPNPSFRNSPDDNLTLGAPIISTVSPHSSFDEELFGSLNIEAKTQNEEVKKQARPGCCSLSDVIGSYYKDRVGAVKIDQQKTAVAIFDAIESAFSFKAFSGTCTTCSAVEIQQTKGVVGVSRLLNKTLLIVTDSGGLIKVFEL